MNKPVVQLGPDAVKQIAKWVRENARRIVNERPVRQRWQQQQPSAVTLTGLRIYTLAVRGNADGGTIDWECLNGAAYLSGTWNFDDNETDIHSSLVSFDAAVWTFGGDLRWNVVKIKFSDPDTLLRITGTALTRETNGITPRAELSSCIEAGIA